MGFNLMAALGGAGRAMSENMAARQLQMDKLELIDTELETRNRLKRSEERDAENKAIEKNTQLLKSLNFTDSQAAWIAKGGQDQVDMYVDFAAKALSRNIDPTTLIDSPMINTDHQDPRNESTLLSVNREADDFMTESGEKKLATGVLKEVLGEDVDVKDYPTLQAGYSAAVGDLERKQNKHGENSDEALAAQKSVDYWKDKIENAPQSVKSNTEWYSISSRETIEKNALITGQLAYKLPVDPITGAMKEAIEGKLATEAMAMLSAVEIMRIKASPAPGVIDSRLTMVADKLTNDALDLLERHGKNVVAPKVENVAQYGSQFSYLKTPVSEFGKQSFDDAIAEQTRKNYKVGDVIVVNRDGKMRILVYTGKQTEANTKSMFYDAGEYIND